MIYQDVAQTDDGIVAVTGQEVPFFGPSRAINLICKSNGESDYVCEKFYPAMFVDTYGSGQMYREPVKEKPEKRRRKKP